jgi:NAD(P)-dependent dehydrogenase (short-subunit alcohol dehydrogenase family)
VSFYIVETNAVALAGAFEGPRQRSRNTIMSNEQKVAIITGASQGIGSGLVQAYRDRHYHVVANSRSIRSGNDTGVHAVPGDIADPETADRIVRETMERFGRIDTLVNNAGVFLSKPFTEFTREDFELNMGVNVAGFFYITQRVAVEMLKRGSGHIVNITASVANQAITGVPAALASITKGGLNAVTKSLAIEFAKTGIRVNAVAPGVIKTPMHSEETHAALSTLHPVGRIGEISDVTDAVLYLENAHFVTGEILYVDGGQNAGR